MRSVLSISTVLFGLVTALFLWMYVQRAQLEYNADGRYFSADEGVVYLEQTRDTYGLLVLIGFITTAFLVTVWIRSMKIIDRTERH